MRVAAMALVLGVLSWGSESAGQSRCCRSCPASERDPRGCCPDSFCASRPIERTSERTPRTSNGCADGRVRAGGHCCWPGQMWSESDRACRGIPESCPAGRELEDEACACTGGREETPRTDGHCCWPGQAWSAQASRCRGQPSACPGGAAPEGESCGGGGAPGGDHLEVDARLPARTGVEVQAGQRLSIQARGRWCWADAPACCGPAGERAARAPSRLLDGAPIGALIGRIGGGDFFVVGARASVRASTSGELQLVMNDQPGSTFDNSGALDVWVQTE